MCCRPVRSPEGPDTIDAAFRIHEERTLTGALSWAARAGHGTTDKRNIPLVLAGRYTCRWQDYSQVTLTNSRVALFRYLLLPIGPGVGSADPGMVSPDRADKREPSQAPALPSRSSAPPTTGTARLEILAAARTLAGQSADGSFTLMQILAEMQRTGTRYSESTTWSSVEGRIPSRW